MVVLSCMPPPDKTLIVLSCMPPPYKTLFGVLLYVLYLCVAGLFLRSSPASFKRTLLQCCDGGETLDVFFFGLLNERREFR